MIVDHRTYKVRPGTLPQQLAIYEKSSPAAKCHSPTCWPRSASSPTVPRAERLLQSVGAADADGKAVAKLIGSVHGALKSHDGIAVRLIGSDMPARWVILTREQDLSLS